LLSVSKRENWRNKKSLAARLEMSNIMKFPLPLINTHTHAAMIAFRGLAEDLPLHIWLEKYIWPMEKERINQRFVYEQTKKAIKEMRQNGIHAFCDMYFFAEEVAKAAEELKMTAVVGEGIIDFLNPNNKKALKDIEKTEKLLEKYKNHPFISVAVCPHSIYTVSKENLVRLKKLAEKYNAIYHIHLAETKKEFDDCKKTHKLTPTEYLDKLGLLDEKTLLAHCVWLNGQDIKIIAKRKCNVSHCPLSNLKLGSGIAPIAKMIEAGITVSLGTDGAASSNRLDIWEAGKIAALLQKGINQDPVTMPAKQTIEMMTINGLKVLHIDNINGESVNEIKEKLNNIEDFSCLYRLNANEIDFN